MEVMMHLSLKMLGGKKGGEQPVCFSPIKVIRCLPWTSASGFVSLRRGVLPQQDFTGQVVSVQGLFFMEHC